MELHFSSDTKQRKWRFNANHFAHPAKMILPLQIWLIQHYTKPGDWILDPMAGSGTLLVACSLSRNVLCVELEDKFILMMIGGDCDGYRCTECQEREEWAAIETEEQFLEMADKRLPKDKMLERAYQQLRWQHTLRLVLHKFPRPEPHTVKGNWQRVQEVGPEMGHVMGEMIIKQGDARQLEGVLADVIITSPPYAQAVTGEDGIDWSKGTTGKSDGNKPRDKSKEPAFKHLAIGGAGFKYSDSKQNIGNLRYGSVDAVITSPLYGSGGTKADENPENYIRREEERLKKFPNRPKTFVGRYSGDRNNIGNLAYGSIDAIDNNANKCYNVDKCQLGFILELKNTGKPYQGGKKPNGQMDGQMLGDISALIVGVRLIDEQSDVELVQRRSDLISHYPKRVNKGLGRVIQSIKGCLASDIQLNQELGCLLHSSRVENLERLLINAITIRWNGRNGASKCLNEINLPAKFAIENQEKGKLYILSHTTLSQLLTNQSLSLKSQMGLPCVETATIKPKAIKANLISETYLSAMLAVYKQAFLVLRDSGVMCLVVKNFLRQGKEIPLDTHTIQLAESVGFSLLERHYRVLTQQSFWRTIYAQKYPNNPVINREHILVFRK